MKVILSCDCKGYGQNFFRMISHGFGFASSSNTLQGSCQHFELG
nr:unnamed protein product [Digitaria exilis]